MRLARYERAGEARLAMVAGEDILDILAVSYTHLKLPTIVLV